MQIQLTISLLVSDRIDTLGKCLDSIKPLLTELNSELIVVYTGKDPGTLELAKRYTSHIIPFAWCNDFSKARNAGLKEANGEWFLYLDDDEWFEDTTEIIEFFKRGEYQNYQAATYVQRNYNDLKGSSYIDANVGRMCRITPDTKFVFPIHENLSPFSEPYKQFRCYVHHYGYVGKKGDENNAPKFERNVSLLLKLYHEEPTAQNCMQLVQEYKTVDDYETAIKYCKEGLKLAEREQRIHTYELWMQVQLPLLLSSSGDKKGAVREAERLLGQPRTLEVGRAHLSSLLSGLCWGEKNYQKGLKYARRYHKEMGYLEKHPLIAQKQNGVTITYESAKDDIMTTYLAGLLCASELRDASSIAEILTWIPWEDTQKVFPQYSNLEKWKWGYPELREKILEGYYRLNTDSAYVNLQKAYYAEYNCQTAKVENFWNRCINNYPDGFQYQLAQLAVNNGISPEPLLKQTSIESWDSCTDLLADHINISDMPEFLKRFEQTAENYPIFSRRLEQRFLEKQLGQESLTDSQLYELLKQYCNCITREAGALYRDEILSSPGCYALPYLYKFALAMKKAYDAFETGDYLGGVPFLEKSVRSFPGMSDMIRRLLVYIEEKTKVPQSAVSDEFAVLGRQVKQILLGLVENKQWEEAYSVVNQLITLLPNDLEILKLKQEIMNHII